MAESESGTKNVRIATIVFERVLEISNDGLKDGKCAMTGFIGEVLTSTIDRTRKYTNCSLHVVDEIGKLNKSTGMYDGAIGMVQRGEMDMVSLPVYYPLHDLNDTFFDYTNPLVEDEMMIVSTYMPILNGSAADVLDMFTSASPDLWWATVIGFLTFVATLKLGYNILEVAKEYKEPIWMVICAFLSEDNFPEDILFNKIITVTACVYLFFFGNYLMNSMSTDLVVFEKAEVITSYQDILDRNASGRKIEVIFPPALPESSIFSDADNGTLHELYKLRLPISIHLPVDAMISRLQKPLINQTAVGILREVAVLGCTAAVFHMLEEFNIADVPDDLHVFFAKDPSMVKYLNVMVFSKTLDAVSKGQIIRMAKMMQEAGLQEFAFNSIPLKFGQTNGYMALFTRAGTQVETGDAGLPEVAIANTVKMFLLIAILFVICCLALIVEHLVFRLSGATAHGDSTVVDDYRRAFRSLIPRFHWRHRNIRRGRKVNVVRVTRRRSL